MAHPLSSQATDADTTDYNDEILDIVKKTAKACSSLVELAVVIHQELVPHDHQRSQLDEAWSHSMLTAVCMQEWFCVLMQCSALQYKLHGIILTM